MELGLGLRTCFPLETKNPIFLNFKLSEEEQKKIQASLPTGYRLEKIKFCQDHTEQAYWLSANFYSLHYPKPELAHIRKSRCEINTFVRDAQGRVGIYVFCGSPYVSREIKFSFFGSICDLAERAVIWIYGCGKLVSLNYQMTADQIQTDLQVGPNRMVGAWNLAGSTPARLSDDYWRFNDISFFNSGRSIDWVNASSDFYLAQFSRLPQSVAGSIKLSTPFVERPADEILYYRGSIAYLVNSMNPVK